MITPFVFLSLSYLGELSNNSEKRPMNPSLVKFSIDAVNIHSYVQIFAYIDKEAPFWLCILS